MTSIICTITKMCLISFSLMGDYNALKGLKPKELALYLTSCYYACATLKEPDEIDVAVFLGDGSDKLLKYVNDTPLVSRKNEAIKYLSVHVDKQSAIQLLVMNIKQRDMLSLAIGNKLKKNDFHANRAVQEFIKKGKDDAIKALGIASKCDLSIFEQVLNLVSVEYTEAEVEEMLDKVHVKK